MYCRKCGKNSKDTNKFCPYCGCNIQDEKEKTGKKMKDAGIKKWEVPLIVGIGALLIAGVVFGGVSVIKKYQEVQSSSEAVVQDTEVSAIDRPSDISKDVSEKQQETIQQPTKAPYPQDITLEEEQVQGIVDLLDIICTIDGANLGRNLENNKEINDDFIRSFLIWSIWKEVPFADGSAVELSGSGWQVSEEMVNAYLSNSINVREIKEDELITVSDGMVAIGGVTPTAAYAWDSIQFDKVTRISEEEINIQGTVYYISEFPETLPYKTAFDVVMLKNPDSMWSGYTLKTINAWEEVKNETLSGSVHEISNEEKERLTEFLFLLGEIDFRGTNQTGVKEIYEYDKREFGADLLFFSLIDKFDIMEENYYAVDYGDSWEVRREQISSYLLNSAGSTERNGNNVISGSEGFVRMMKANPPYLEVRDVKIENIASVSDTEIQIQGSMVYYDPDENLEIWVSAQITMMKNPNSVWGGYTLQSIDQWSRYGKTREKVPFAVTASSVLQQEGYYYGVENLTDGNAATCWAEGSPGDGEGESILFTSRQPQTVEGLAILPGYLKSEDLYGKNGKPLEIWISSGYKTWRKNVLTGFWPNYHNPQRSMIYVDFDEAIDMDTCKVTISQAQPGGSYDDLCISEMYLYQYQ